MSARVSSNDVGSRPLSSSGGVTARRHESCFRFEPYQALTGNRLAGSGHGSDVPFHFQTLSVRGTPSKENLTLSEMISCYDVNFAKTGNPNGKGLPPWPAFTDKNQLVMVFDAAPSARPYPLLQRVRVLDSYFGRVAKEK